MLFASRRRSSGAIEFPAERAELFDGDPEIQDAVGFVELPEGVLVEALIVGVAINA